MKRLHGHSNPPTSTYSSWSHMKQRCTNPNDQDYARYGGRGITLCERWFFFENFLADMGECPPWATGGIDRIDTSGNYEPGNCRWSTRKEQGRDAGEHLRAIMHCPHDHPYDSQNTLVRCDGRRVCLTCKRERDRRSQRRRRMRKVFLRAITQTR